jgi:hypothetical protein
MVSRPFRRLPAYPADDVVAVPRVTHGSRMMVVICGLGALLAALVLGLALWAPSAVHATLGLTEQVSANVVGTRLNKVSSGPRSFGCDSRHYDVQWAQREGEFSVCVNSRHADLAVGDRVQVLTLPWTDDVTPVGESSFWTVLILVVCSFLVWVGIRAAVRHGRLASGTARGPRYDARVIGVDRNGITVRLEGGPHELRMLMTMRHRELVPGQRVEVWGSGGTLFRKRPHGPWAVRAVGSQGPARSYTPAWVRREVPQHVGA